MHEDRGKSVLLHFFGPGRRNNFPKMGLEEEKNVDGNPQSRTDDSSHNCVSLCIRSSCICIRCHNLIGPGMWEKISKAVKSFIFFSFFFFLEEALGAGVTWSTKIKLLDKKKYLKNWRCCWKKKICLLSVPSVVWRRPKNSGDADSSSDIRHHYLLSLWEM